MNQPKSLLFGPHNTFLMEITWKMTLELQIRRERQEEREEPKSTYTT